MFLKQIIDTAYTYYFVISNPKKFVLKQTNKVDSIIENFEILD